MLASPELCYGSFKRRLNQKENRSEDFLLESGALEGTRSAMIKL